jgi:hypothetical protein
MHGSEDSYRKIHNTHDQLTQVDLASATIPESSRWSALSIRWGWLWNMHEAREDVRARDLRVSGSLWNQTGLWHCVLVRY